MKKNLLTYAFVCCLHFGYAQIGELDPSFGKNGIVTTEIGSAFNFKYVGKQVLPGPDGSMYLVNENLKSIASDPFVLGSGFTIITKRKADGSLDLSYGNNGYSHPVPIYSARAAMQADGKIVVTGAIASRRFEDFSDLATARFKTDGSLDSSFSDDGISVVSSQHSDFAACLAIQSDGKIVVGGSTIGNLSYGFIIVRYNPDGSVEKQLLPTSITPFTALTSVAIQGDGKILFIVYSGVYELVRFDANLELDNSFNGNGRRALNENYYFLAIQNDGKILTAGLSFNNGSEDFGLARYNSDGSTDNTFDGDGFQNTDFGSADYVTSLAIQNDGKILLAGTTGTGNNIDFALARYNTDGSPDNSFSGDGKQTTDFGSTRDYINALAIQGDRKILALGYSINGVDSLIVAVRYDNTGNPDPSFDGDGLLTDQIRLTSSFYTCTAVQSDGKVLAAGYAWNGTNYDFALARYNINGSQDNSFSGDGKQMTDFGSNDRARAIAIQSDGKIVLAGIAGNDFALARYNTNGTPDNTFDSDGMLTTDFGAVDSVNSIAIQNDGKIVAGGTALARYNVNGALDVSFDGDGKSTTPLGGQFPFNCNDLALQNDGKIIVIGSSQNINSYDCAITRYNIDGSVDYAFAGVGAAVLHNREFTDVVGKSIAIQNDGKIVIGGYNRYVFRSVAGTERMIARLNSDGSLDNTIDFRNSPTDGFSYGTSVAIQSDNKIILGGYSFNNNSNNFTIVRYNTDGSLDNSFSDDGITITEASLADDRIADITLFGNLLYAAGFGQFPGNSGVVAQYLLDPDCNNRLVSVTDFKVDLSDKSVLLQWQTTNEQNLSRIVIERSANGYNFSPIENITAKGNISSKINYLTIDKQPLEWVNYYRLKMVDKDGKFIYSKILSVNINGGVFTWKVSPNPASDILFVRTSSENVRATFKIIGSDGRKLQEIKVFLYGNTAFPVPINSLPKGIYTLQLQTATRTEVRRFVKE